MLLSGKFEPWLDAFPRELLPEIFEVVIETWPSFCEQMPKRPIERRLNHSFTRCLQRTARNRRTRFNFDCHYPLLDPNGDVELGELDIRVTASLAEDVYFAFECKRLYPTKARSRAETYTGLEGMQCFLTGQYDGKAGAAGMLGYVIHGGASRARDAVAERIQEDQKYLLLEPPAQLMASALHPEFPQIEQTKHSKPCRGFVIYHLFLSFEDDLGDSQG